MSWNTVEEPLAFNKIVPSKVAKPYKSAPVLLRNKVVSIWFIFVFQGEKIEDIPKEVLMDCAHLVKANSIQGQFS